MKTLPNSRRHTRRFDVSNMISTVVGNLNMDERPAKVLFCVPLAKIQRFFYRNTGFLTL